MTQAIFGCNTNPLKKDSSTKSHEISDYLLGEWWLTSCDINCNVCPKILFKPYGYASIFTPGNREEIIRYAINLDTISIFNISQDAVIHSGKYQITKTNNNRLVQLSYNASDCYFLNR